MARIRSIKPGFFTNDQLAEIDPLGRLLFAGLWCHADRAGRLEDRPRKIKAEVLPYDECDVDALLNALVAHGFIVRYQANGTRYIQVVTFHLHQTPNIKEVQSTIPPPVEHSTPDTPAQYEHSASTVPALHLTDLLTEQEQEQIQVLEGVQGEAAAPPDSDPDQEPVPLNRAKAATKRHEATFEHFWRVWPKKEAKAKALAVWIRLKPSPDTVQAIIEAVPRHQAAKDWSRENWRYCPNPATWLNEHRWDDELPQEYPHETSGRNGQGRRNRFEYQAERLTVGAPGSHGAGGTDSWSTGPPVRTGGGT